MPLLNADRIINGTNKKQLIHAYESLKANYSDDSAIEYRKYYMEKPLSFILENVDMIIAEPRYGLPFIEWVSENAMVPFINLQNTYEAVSSYIKEHGRKMNESLLSLYESCEEKLNRIMDSRTAEAAVESYVLESEMTDEERNTFVNNTFAMLMENENDTPLFFKGVNFESIGRENYLQYLESCPNTVVSMMLTPFNEKFHIEKELFNSYKGMLATECSDDTILKSYASNLSTCYKFQCMKDSKRFMESVSRFTNENLRIIAKGILETNIANGILEAFHDHCDNTINPIYESSRTAVNAIMEEALFDEIYKEDREKLRADLLNMKHAIYECVRCKVEKGYEIGISAESEFEKIIRESMEVFDELDSEKRMLLMNEAVSEIEAEMNKSFFEYANKGSMNKVIAKRHAVLREEDDKKKSSNTEVIDDEDSEIPDRAKVANTSSDLPSSANPNATKPQKPKTGFVSKVQNAAMDAHAASKQTGAKLRKAGTGVMNAGKAILKIPAGILQGFKDVIQKFDEMDDNRRKEYMAQPGYRKKIFKNIRVAATYGAAGYINPLLLPVTWFGRKLSKEKNKRLRIEFTRDLETEIKVCEQKIEDAKAAGDQKEVYQLMRIRDAYSRERDRVALNAKYI